MNSELRRIRLKVYGQVQGVFFRANARKKAEELDLPGWVRNEPDGTVSVIAEGPEKNLKKLIEWCYNIPSAKVDKIDVEWKEASGEFKDFEIKY